MEVLIYEDLNGNKPYYQWLKKIKDHYIESRIKDRIVRIEIFDLFGDHKKISKNLYELRLHFGKGYRIYFTKKDNKIIIILGGGDKSTQKKDIKKAQEILKILEND